MINYLSTKSFDREVRDEEMRLRRLELKFSKDSIQYKTRAKALEIKKKNYARSNSKPVVGDGVSNAV